jgi:phage shock protein E
VTSVTMQAIGGTEICAVHLNQSINRKQNTMGLFSMFGGGGKQDAVKEMLAKGAMIIDVRTPDEYRSGHITNSVNIPLNLLPGKVNDLKRKNKPIITCCRSGARSGMAADQLKSAGIDVMNGGGWDSLEAMMAK